SRRSENTAAMMSHSFHAPRLGGMRTNSIPEMPVAERSRIRQESPKTIVPKRLCELDLLLDWGDRIPSAVTSHYNQRPGHSRKELVPDRLAGYDRAPRAGGSSP